ncbi:MAG: cellulase family glycosylhydrolase [Planctomycetes bacterium]|nr:cellulase family glycosylhydrolase [Planctomycetota bacterium]
MKPIHVLCAAALALAFAGIRPGAASAAEGVAPPGLSIRNGVVTKDGRPFRGIGVNYFDAFARTLKNPADTSYEAGFKVLADRRIPFARFMCGGFWPSEMKAYQEDRAGYFARLDAVMKAAERHGIGLIPSLFWHIATVPDLVGEPCDAWGDPKSKTHAFMRAYTREVVTRYRASPAIWGWEFGNEYNLPADLPNAAEHRPPVVPQLGTPASRTARDELTHAQVRTALAEFAREVRRHDPHRLITSGNAFPRATAWHQQREKSWTADTPDESAEMLLADNTDPMNVLRVHWYQEPASRLAAAMATAAKARKPLFVGEFGVPGPRSAETEKRFREMMAALERERVPLAALWVFDYEGQADDWNVTATGGRAYQLEAVAEANARIRGDAAAPARGTDGAGR